MKAQGTAAGNRVTLDLGPALLLPTEASCPAFWLFVWWWWWRMKKRKWKQLMMMILMFDLLGFWWNYFVVVGSLGLFKSH